MAASLFEQVKVLAPPEVVERLAGALGETPLATDRAFTGAAIPAVLGGLERRFGSGAGPARLMGVIKQQDPNGRLLDNLQAGFNGPSPAQGLSDAEHVGHGMIGSLFGEHSDQVADAVAAHGGIKRTSAMSLLSLAGVMILGFFGQRVARGGLDAGGLGAMLTNAHDELGNIAPAGLASAMSGRGAPPERERERERAGTYAAAAPARDALYRDEPAVPRTDGAGRRGEPAHGKAAAHAGRRSAWWWVPLLIVLGLIAWWLSRLAAPHHVPTVTPPHVSAPAAPTVTPPRANTPNASTPQTAAPTANAPQGGGTAAGTTNAPHATGNAAPATMPSHALPPAAPGRVGLPNGTQLQLAPGSLTYNLANYLGSPNAPSPQRFTFQNLSFPTAGSDLSVQSQGVLNDVATILRAYPNARVQVQGFTDNVGSPQANLALSQGRANAVRAALIQRGIAPNRVSARGFGENNPVSNNVTPGGRAQNRRTDLVVLSR